MSRVVPSVSMSAAPGSLRRHDEMADLLARRRKVRAPQERARWRADFEELVHRSDPDVKAVTEPSSTPGVSPWTAESTVKSTAVGPNGTQLVTMKGPTGHFFWSVQDPDGITIRSGRHVNPAVARRQAEKQAVQWQGW